MIYQALDEFTENLIVDDYEKGKTYNEGDYCLYDDTLWLCIASHTATDFDPTKWQKVTITDVLKILNDMLRTTIETVNTTVQSVNITIQTVQGLIATVTEMQGTMSSYDDRITALENAPTADSNSVVYDATFASVPGENYYVLTLTNSKTWGNIYDDYNTNKKFIVIRAVFGGTGIIFDFIVHRASAVSGTSYPLTLICWDDTMANEITFISNYTSNTVNKSGNTINMYMKRIAIT